MEKGNKALSITDFENHIQKGALILDVRKSAEFAQGHIPNALFIGLDGQFAPWVGSIITDLKQPIILVTPQGKEEETVMRLSRVGYDNCLGYLKGGFDTWKQAGKQVESITSISAEEFSKLYGKENTTVLDVRKPGEYDAKHLNKVNPLPLDFIGDWQDTLDKNKNYYIYCAGGYRSMIAASILKAKGYKNLIDVAGGFGAITKTNIPVEAYAVTCANA
jgi:rhodanese-related sulfurtransferase